jgi:hypothetical protein
VAGKTPRMPPPSSDRTRKNAIYLQGSTALRTTVRPIAANEHDVDLVAHVSDLDVAISPAALKKAIGDCLRANGNYARAALCPCGPGADQRQRRRGGGLGERIHTDPAWPKRSCWPCKTSKVVRVPTPVLLHQADIRRCCSPSPLPQRRRSSPAPGYSEDFPSINSRRVTATMVEAGLARCLATWCYTHLDHGAT